LRIFLELVLHTTPGAPNLRVFVFFQIKKFHSYLINYREKQEGIEVIRVLHSHMQKHTRVEPEN